MKTHKSLHIPWFLILGNHDYYAPGNPQAQIDYRNTHHMNF